MNNSVSSPLRRSKTNAYACVRGLSVRPFPNHLPATLDLPIPWDIPLECQLNAPQKKQIQTTLHQLSQVLQSPDTHQALVEIDYLLSRLDYPQTQIAQVEYTKTSLKTDEVDDFDQYFGIHHVQTDDIALCLVRGLLVNCQKFMILCENCPQLDSRHVTQQKQGFVSYIHLLARVFYLDGLNDAPSVNDPQ
jgi:hypothetical protein